MPGLRKAIPPIIELMLEDDQEAVLLCLTALEGVHVIGYFLS